jgi:hypothetical protein
MAKDYVSITKGLSAHRRLELRYFCMQYETFKARNPAAARMIEQAAIAADAELYEFLIGHVSEGTPYGVLRDARGMPCGKGRFYASRRRFFRILDRMRG